MTDEQTIDAVTAGLVFGPGVRVIYRGKDKSSLGVTGTIQHATFIWKDKSQPGWIVEWDDNTGKSAEFSHELELE